MSPLSDLLSDRPDFSIEKELYSRGYRYIAGVDEAGRGALAGPLSLGMVIYPLSVFNDIPESVSKSIADSKKLTAKKRVEALSIIMNYSLSFTSAFVSHTAIDNTNINIATKDGIHKLLAGSEIKPDVIIMDGNFKFKFDIPFISVIKGDNRSISIASASIIAKVSRDELMDKLDCRYPGYGFCGNKGYGTREHMACLADKGFSSIHRKSYEPVKSLIEGQRLLFDEDIS
jgi:ribonuclease HII